MKISTPLLGILLMIAATMFLPLKDGIAKVLGDHYSPWWLLWLQYLFMYLVYAPFIVRSHGTSVLWPRPVGLQFLRGICIIGAVGGFYWALQFIPLADATAISFIGPIVTTALSPFFLKEHVGIRRWTAVVAGFCGVLLILRPDLGGERVGYLISLGAGFFAGTFYVLNRKLAGVSAPMVTVTYTAFSALILLTLILPFVWSQPRGEDFLPLLAFVAISLIGQTLLVISFNHGPASVISPFIYGNIIMATALGYFVFDDFPPLLTWIGIAVLIASGIYIAVRESRQKRVPSA